MTTSCPYCGATLNLNYCVVCGRQSNVSMNKMGNLKTVARNTDATQRLENPFESSKRKREQMLRHARKIGSYFVKVVASGLLIAALVIIITNQATDLFQMQASVAPWMKSHRLVFPAKMQLNIETLKASLNRATAPPTVKKQKHAYNKRNHRTENQKTKSAK